MGRLGRLVRGVRKRHLGFAAAFAIAVAGGATGALLAGGHAQAVRHEVRTVFVQRSAATEVTSTTVPVTTTSTSVPVTVPVTTSDPAPAAPVTSTTQPAPKVADDTSTTTTVPVEQSTTTTTAPCGPGSGSLFECDGTPIPTTTIPFTWCNTTDPINQWPADSPISESQAVTGDPETCQTKDPAFFYWSGELAGSPVFYTNPPAGWYYE